MRRSVKFNLESAFAQMEGDLLAMENDAGDDEKGEEIVVENDGGSPKKNTEEVAIDVTNSNNNKKEGDPIFKNKKRGFLGCGCVIL